MLCVSFASGWVLCCPVPGETSHPSAEVRQHGRFYIPSLRCELTHMAKMGISGRCGCPSAVCPHGWLLTEAVNRGALLRHIHSTSAASVLSHGRRPGLVLGVCSRVSSASVHRCPRSPSPPSHSQQQTPHGRAFALSQERAEQVDLV